MIEFGLSLLHVRVGLILFGFEHVQIGQRLIDFGFELFQIRLGLLQLGFRRIGVGFSLRDAGAIDVNLRFGLRQVRVVERGVDLRKHCSGIDDRAVIDLLAVFVHAEGVDLPGDLRADIDDFFGFDSARGGYGLNQTAFFDGGRLVGAFRNRSQLQIIIIPTGANAADDQNPDDGFKQIHCSPQIPHGGESIS